MKKIALVFSLMIAIAGCAAPGHLSTPSGRPEVTVHASMQEAQKESEHWLLANGFTVGNQDPTKQIIFIAGFQFKDGGATSLRISFNYYQKDSTTTTIYGAKDYYYRHQSGAHPQTSQADYDEVQADLNAIAQNLSASK